MRELLVPNPNDAAGGTPGDERRPGVSPAPDAGEYSAYATALDAPTLTSGGDRERFAAPRGFGLPAAALPKPGALPNRPLPSDRDLSSTGDQDDTVSRVAGGGPRFGTTTLQSTGDQTLGRQTNEITQERSVTRKTRFLDPDQPVRRIVPGSDTSNFFRADRDQSITVRGGLRTGDTRSLSPDRRGGARRASPRGDQQEASEDYYTSTDDYFSGGGSAEVDGLSGGGTRFQQFVGGGREAVEDVVRATQWGASKAERGISDAFSGMLHPKDRDLSPLIEPHTVMGRTLHRAVGRRSSVGEVLRSSVLSHSRRAEFDHEKTKFYAVWVDPAEFSYPTFTPEAFVDHTMFFIGDVMRQILREFFAHRREAGAAEEANRIDQTMLNQEGVLQVKMGEGKPPSFSLVVCGDF